jgi:hypothetical protein
MVFKTIALNRSATLAFRFAPEKLRRAQKWRKKPVAPEAFSFYFKRLVLFAF